MPDGWVRVRQHARTPCVVLLKHAAKALGAARAQDPGWLLETSSLGGARRIVSAATRQAERPLSWPRGVGLDDLTPLRAALLT